MKASLRGTEIYFDTAGMQLAPVGNDFVERPVEPFSKSKTIWSYEALNEGFGHFLRDFDFIPRLKKIAAPTLVLAGGRDWICSPAQSKMIAKHVPNAQLKIFRDAGHTVAIDAHKAYIRTIKKFLNEKVRKRRKKKNIS